ncbi:Rac/Rho-like_protein [Hexamita inflata]|uniref:Rac/Rho-like protein n=1 Tax=Hexamita inflata TaxID=28002 RepID=A0AA86RPK8_9EUKA|nr:Rac/Rho-like protein [Hexamita inflata]
MKFVIVGDGAVGKTRLLQTFGKKKFEYENIISSFSFDFRKIVAQNTEYSFIVLETLGNSVRTRQHSYKDTDVFIVCYSVDSLLSLNNVVDMWIPEILQCQPNIPFILVGTKCDLDCDSLQDRAEEIVKYYNASSYVLCSAANSYNIKLVFHEAVRVALKNSLNQ